MVGIGEAYTHVGAVLFLPTTRMRDQGLCDRVCLWTQKIFESYFSDRLTFSNIRSRTSRQIYRLALSLHAPETPRISIFNVHLTLLSVG